MIVERLEKADLQNLIHAQKSNGRRSISNAQTSYWKSVHQTAKTLAGNANGDQRQQKIAQWLSLVTESVATLADDPAPKYYDYAEMNIIEWFIGHGKGHNPHYKEKIIEGILHLIKDFLEFEEDSISGIAVHYQHAMEHIDLHDRLGKLNDLYTVTQKAYHKVAGHYFSDFQSPSQDMDIEAYALDETKVSTLMRFTCFPRTEVHDEFAFLKTIQISEFCYLGIIHSVKEAIDHIEARRYALAEKCLDHACLFVSILHGCFKVLRTMPSKPVNNFALFRDDINKGSAIQSKNYHELDVVLRGMDPRKIHLFDEHESLTYIKKYMGEYSKYNLKAVFARLNPADCPGLFKKGKELDKKLISWRGLHLGFVYAYLSRTMHGTGNTTGAAYLEQFFKASIFDKEQAGPMHKWFRGESPHVHTHAHQHAPLKCPVFAR